MNMPTRYDPFGNQLFPRLTYKHGRYWHTPYVRGKVRWQALSTDYAEALREWVERESPRFKGETVQDATDRFVLYVLPQLAESTQREYRRYKKKIDEVYGHCHLDDLQESDIAQYLDNRSAPVEANREISFFSSVFESARRWGWTSNNPCRVRRNSEAALKFAPSASELKRWQLGCSPLLSCVTDLILTTALRKKDVLALTLTREHITAEGLRVRISKKARRVRMRHGRRTTEIETIHYWKVYAWTAKLRAIIARAKHLRRRVGSVYLFATRDGQQYSSSGFDSLWQSAQRRTKTKVTPHSLRRLALTNAKKARGVEYAQALADHEDVSTTERYISDGELRFVDPLE